MRREDQRCQARPEELQVAEKQPRLQEGNCLHFIVCPYESGLKVHVCRGCYPNLDLIVLAHLACVRRNFWEAKIGNLN